MEQTTNPRSLLRNSFPFFSKPKLIGFFSVGAKRNYMNDYSQLKYVNKIPVGKVTYDLNHNISSALKRIESEERLKFLLEYFNNHKEAFNVFDKSEIPLKDVPFMCFRGLLREMSALPYTNQEPLRFSACLFRGVIYLHSLKTPEAVARKANTTEREKTMCAWGYKFEQYIVSDDPSRDPDISPPVDESSEFSAVFESRLNQHRLIYGAEMDGILVEGSSLKEGFRPEEHSGDQVLTELRKLKFVELKTSRKIEERRHDITFRRHKTLSWWLQSFFAGIETIICGFRDDEGIVKEVKTFTMFDLPKQSEDYWHPNVCMNFCDEMLKYIKDCFAREIRSRPSGNIHTVRSLPLLELVFERLPRSNVRMSPPLPNENISILNDWYISMFPKL